MPEGFAAWVESLDPLGQVFLSAVSIHELEKGVRRLEARGARQKARALDSWLRPLVARHAGFILPVDAEVARVSGDLEARAIAAGFNSGASDAMIAGTAQHHGLILLTRNVKHFEPFGISVSVVEGLDL
ncbi:type II toxin-antitoxin system VapC family toxin [Hoeflea sp.]|uniref:type II toxin-antitoxin system VapC family toxin n=1 Tax=Hoeflea sp. TaxID=1940281 RepID=UPI00199E754E|nr:type II toxin-antitoxin system VapC family toxin [Hoeflea sp.]MBC7283658.1 type II toxin-antitoxin system VapC family toxin [Hoeflea sp.]